MSGIPRRVSITLALTMRGFNTLQHTATHCNTHRHTFAVCMYTSYIRIVSLLHSLSLWDTKVPGHPHRHTCTYTYDIYVDPTAVKRRGSPPRSNHPPQNIPKQISHNTPKQTPTTQNRKRVPIAVEWRRGRSRSDHPPLRNPTLLLRLLERAPGAPK